MYNQLSLALKRLNDESSKEMVALSWFSRHNDPPRALQTFAKCIYCITRLHAVNTLQPNKKIILKCMYYIMHTTIHIYVHMNIHIKKSFENALTHYTYIIRYFTYICITCTRLWTSVCVHLNVDFHFLNNLTLQCIFGYWHMYYVCVNSYCHSRENVFPYFHNSIKECGFAKFSLSPVYNVTRFSMSKSV